MDAIDDSIRKQGGSSAMKMPSSMAGISEIVEVARLADIFGSFAAQFRMLALRFSNHF